MPDTLFLSTGVSLGLLAGIVSGVCYIFTNGLAWPKSENRCLPPSSRDICTRCGGDPQGGPVPCICPHHRPVKFESGAWFLRQVQRAASLMPWSVSTDKLEQIEEECEGPESVGAGEGRELRSVREFLEALSSRLAGGAIEAASVTPLYDHPAYESMFERYHPELSSTLAALANALRDAISRKGKRLIVTHIGSEDGFVEGGLMVFESKKQGDYHQDMNAEVFEEWFSKVLDKIPDGSVIVLDNAPYHSRKKEKIPNTQSRKNEIIDWLKERNLYTNNMKKDDLLGIVRAHKNRYEAFVVDELAKQKHKTVLRLPPYHCELNPIEMIWSQIKGYVARNNKTFKLAEVKQLLQEAILKVNAESWKKCVKHVVEVVELKMSTVEPVNRFIINLEDDSSGSDTE